MATKEQLGCMLRRATEALAMSNKQQKGIEEVEKELWAIWFGKRPPPTPAECRDWAVKLKSPLIKNVVPITTKKKE